jgi:hypothetical protein
MRIAIAGSGGLAQMFAAYIHETVHPFIMLSRVVGRSNPLSSKTVDSLFRHIPTSKLVAIPSTSSTTMSRTSFAMRSEALILSSRRSLAIHRST